MDCDVDILEYPSVMGQLQVGTDPARPFIILPDSETIRFRTYDEVMAYVGGFLDAAAMQPVFVDDTPANGPEYLALA